MPVEMDLIVRRHQTVRGIHNPKLVLYCATLQKHLDFQSFHFGLGIDFLSAAATTLVRHLDTLRPETAKNKKNIVFGFLEWLAKHAGQFPVFQKQLKNEYRRCDSRDWEDMIHWWSSSINGRPVYQMRLISTMNTVFDLWADRGIIPVIAKPSIPKGSKGLKRPKKTIAEVGAISTGSGIIEFGSRNEIEKLIERDFRKELSPETLKSGNKAIAFAIKKLIENRLKTLRKHAEAVLLEEYKIFLHGQSLIGKYCDPVKLKKDIAEHFKRNGEDRKKSKTLDEYHLVPCLREFRTRRELPIAPSPKRLGNYLTYLEVFHNGARLSGEFS